MVRPRSVTTSPDPQLSAYSPHFPTGFFRVLTGFFSGFKKKPGKNLVQFSPTPSMADPLWRSPNCRGSRLRVGLLGHPQHFNMFNIFQGQQCNSIPPGPYSLQECPESQICQKGSGTEPEPETGTVGTVFPETESGTGTAGTVFQEPKPEPEPSLPVETVLKQRKPPFCRGTARTENRNRSNPSTPKP